MALDTLFLPFKNESLSWPTDKKAAAFYNAQTHALLPEGVQCFQWFKPYADILGHSETALPEATDSFDLILIALPKNRIESEYLIAHALKNLKNGGTLIAAADNKAGGSRIEKTLKNFDLSPTSLSKNKARVCWATKNSADKSALEKALTAGAPQMLGDIHTWPGIYGWDKIDKGSLILTEHIPETLKGKGADFGCGYGFLTLHALHSCEGIKNIHCVDADERAVKCARKNLESFGEKTSFDWADLTKQGALKNLDFIIMNPPFHEGKKADTGIGEAFIKTAHDALRKHGELYMVANAQLPYEPVLNDTFFKVEKLHEGGGFKVYKATK